MKDDFYIACISVVYIMFRYSTKYLTLHTHTRTHTHTCLILLVTGHNFLTSLKNLNNDEHSHAE